MVMDLCAYDGNANEQYGGIDCGSVGFKLWNLAKMG